MRLDSPENLDHISQKSGFTIFELPETDFAQILPNANHFRPEKEFFTKPEIDDISSLVRTKQTSALTIVLENGENMNDAAANTFLKTLEEPGENIHFVFLVRNINKILPTIKSRAQNYYVVPETQITAAPNIDPELLKTAKEYITCTPKSLPKFCDKIAKDKTDARSKAIAVVDAAIQLVYKSYFVTGQSKYLDRLDNLLKTSEALKANGHIKLQLIAGML
ncbi:hypothetical protein J6X15_01410 [Candidatus Saccharibacteria bacterium]|nr:hypothetical protein [Candidatus Saccharibacteria bacterium]